MPYNPTAREDVIAGLLLKGGYVEHPSGLAMDVLHNAMAAATGKERSKRTLTSLLKAMEADGLIARRIDGRRTFYIGLVQLADATTGSAGRLIKQAWGANAAITDLERRLAELEGHVADLEARVGG